MRRTDIPETITAEQWADLQRRSQDANGGTSTPEAARHRADLLAEQWEK